MWSMGHKDVITATLIMKLGNSCTQQLYATAILCRAGRKIWAAGAQCELRTATLWILVPRTASRFHNLPWAVADTRLASRQSATQHRHANRMPRWSLDIVGLRYDQPITLCIPIIQSAVSQAVDYLPYRNSLLQLLRRFTVVM
jgi:hypothetical protein